MRFTQIEPTHNQPQSAFQFSLWDSWISKEFLHTLGDFGFQFSLWDSRVFILGVKTTTFLSILFMRFKERKIAEWTLEGKLSILFMRFVAEDCHKRIKVFDFQFSLWDSLLCASSMGIIERLSILFMRFSSGPSWFDVVLCTLSILFMRFLSSHWFIHFDTAPSFNSLYEIQKIVFFFLMKHIIISFNSLYEIPKVWERSSINTTYTFNSLYEIPVFQRNISKRRKK